MADDDQAKRMREYSKEIESLRMKTMRKLGKAKDEIDRLSNEVFYNPYDVFLLDASASQEEIKKQFKNLALLLHPDRCKETGAKQAWCTVEQAHRTLNDPEKRKVYLRIMREAKQRASYEQERENKRRAKIGQMPLAESACEQQYADICQGIFKQLQQKKEHIVKLQQSSFAKKKEELQTKKVIEQFRILTQEEWERSRDKRVNNWRQFSKKKFLVGSKRSDGAIRPPPVLPEDRPHYTVIQEKKKNI